MKRSIFWVWLPLLLIAACDIMAVPPTTPPPTFLPATTPTAQPTPMPAYTPTFETAVCQFNSTIEADVQCGYLIVPEDRAHPEPTIRLHVAIIASRSSSPVC